MNDDESIKSTRPLTKIYQECSMIVLELIGYDKAAKDPR